jgi:DNA-binding NtrC family response regulator
VAESTLTVGEAAARTPGGVPYLFVTLNAERPRLPSSRHALAGVEEVTLGRGSARDCLRRGARLELRFADRWMSTEHARLRRDGAAWHLEDRGSKNGLFVNGASTREAWLNDADVVELGHTFLVFRAAQPPLDGAPDFTLVGPPPPLASLSPSLVDAFARLERVAPAALPVLVLGETGTGKELVARAVHERSGRAGPFLAVNCGALPKTLIESELFGFKKGAFSGANEDRAGVIRAAEGGTLFLDEIGELPPAAQAALLRVLQEREVLPIGATRAVAVDVRVVAATHRDLEAEAERGEFRADLLARLAGYVARLLPLRERREDLGLLVGALLDRAGAAGDASFAHLAARALFSRRWSRNVRELERSLAAAVLLTAGQRPIEMDDLFTAREPERPRAGDTPPGSATPSEPRAVTPPSDAPKGRDERRRAQLLALVAEHAGNLAQVARAMGKAREQVSRWCKKYGIDPDHYRR